MAAPLREARRQETRNALLAAAEHVLAARGLSEARVEEIAERAGVSVGTIYNHFRDRDELVDELLAVRRDELEARIADAQNAVRRKELSDRIEALAAAVFEHFAAHPGFVQVALEIEHQKSMHAIRSRSRSVTSLRLVYEAALGLVQSGVRGNELQQQSPEVWASLLTGVIRGMLIYELHQSDTRTPAERARFAARFFLAGAGTGA